MCLFFVCIVLYLSISVALLTACVFQKRSRPQKLTLSEFSLPKCYRQQLVKDLRMVPTWRLERGSNLRLSGRKTSTLPMRHHKLVYRPMYVYMFLCFSLHVSMFSIHIYIIYKHTNMYAYMLVCLYIMYMCIQFN